MKKIIAVAIAATTILGSQVAHAATSTHKAAQATTLVLTVHATGANVTMASNGAMGGASTGSANGRFVVDLKKNTFCYTVTTKGLTGIVAAHIHTGAAGMDGGVAVALNPAHFNKKFATCVKGSPAELGMIATTPANYYFNLHTKKYSDGAVRGQLAARK